jgi:hypothetical protein
MDLTFEWDEVKADANLRKHGVSFEEAKTVFADPHQLLNGSRTKWTRCCPSKISAGVYEGSTLKPIGRGIQ